MKKLISFLIAAALILSGITAYGEVPAFLTESYNNYTADYSMSIRFDNAEELAELIKSSNPDDKSVNAFDLKSIFSSMLSLDAAMNVRANISDDYKKIQLSSTADYFYDAEISSNLTVAVKATAGVWMNIDLTAAEPVLEMIYIYPYSNKYIKHNILEDCTDEEKAQLTALLNLVCSKEFIDPINSTAAQLLEKHAVITVSGSTCTVEIDNSGFIAMLEDFIAVFGAKIASMMPYFTDAASIGIIGEADGSTAVYIGEDEASEMAPEELFPTLDGVRLLGENGMVCKYTLSGGKLSKGEMDVDVSVNLSEIMGEDWTEEMPLNLDFSIEYDMNISEIGTTKVIFPELTEENSIAYKDLQPTYEYSGDYPHYYVEFTTDEIITENGEFYVPLRRLMNEAYGDEITIEYQDGAITLQSQWFTDFSKLTLYENSTVAYTDETEITVSPVIEKDGTAYVSCNLIQDVFGWTLQGVHHMILDETFSVSFSTYSYEYEYEEYEPTYPHYYASAYPEELIVIDGEYYTPLRELIYSTYDEEATIEYADGVITLQSQWFPGFTTLTLYEDSTTAYKDSNAITVDRVIIKDGVTYVSCRTIEDIFGWTLTGLTHDMLSSYYCIFFETNIE